MYKTARAVVTFTITTILGLCIAQAQEAKPQPLHPGDVLKFEILFSGPDADRINSSYLGLGLTGQRKPDQVGFNTGFGGGATKVAPRTFHVEAKIPDNIATGDYVVNRVDGNADIGANTYNSGFGTFTYHIENPKTFTPPSVSVKPLP